MIDNYLDWVKRQRKYNIQKAVSDARGARSSSSSWAQGFYAGCSCTHDFAGQMLKLLQKDIEARIAHGRRIVIMPAHRDGYDEILS